MFCLASLPLRSYIIKSFTLLLLNRVAPASFISTAKLKSGILFAYELHNSSYSMKNI